MNKNDFVIHSDDPYLLARMCTELQMEGCSVNDDSHLKPPVMPDMFETCLWLCSYGKKVWSYMNFESCGVPEATRLWLTSRNYLEVLQTVLAEKGGEG